MRNKQYHMKKMYMWSCPSYKNTITRMAMGAALMTDEHEKNILVQLRTWLIDNYTEESYPAFYEEMRNEMDKYYHPLGDGKLTVIPKGERL